VIAVTVGCLFYLQPWHRPAQAPQSTDGRSARDDLESRLDDHVRQSRGPRNRAIAALLISVLVAGTLLLFMPHRDRTEAGHEGYYTTEVDGENAGAKGGAGATGGQAPANGASSANTALWAAASMGCVAIIAGVVLLVVGPNAWVRLAGTVPLALGLTANGYVIKEVKVGELIKFDTKVDKVALDFDLAWKAKLEELSAFGSERLAELNDFAPGQADLRPGMDEQIEGLCKRWNQPEQVKRPGLLLIAGSTDRVPLSASLRKRYESNIGLARARAEKVRERMLACLTSEAPILTVTTGPVYTPALTGREAPGGARQDRSVVVWALWNVPKEKK
jgi:flagellar motor protein MotB